MKSSNIGGQAVMEGVMMMNKDAIPSQYAGRTGRLRLK